MGCKQSTSAGNAELPPLDQLIRNEHYKHAPAAAILADSQSGITALAESQALHMGQPLFYVSGNSNNISTSKKHSVWTAQNVFHEQGDGFPKRVNGARVNKASKRRYKTLTLSVPVHGLQVVLKPKLGQPNSANCDGIYEQVRILALLVWCD
jgi:hypothetical protein